jgi:hypothetical protein
MIKVKQTLAAVSALMLAGCGYTVNGVPVDGYVVAMPADPSFALEHPPAYMQVRQPVKLGDQVMGYNAEVYEWPARVRLTENDPRRVVYVYIGGGDAYPGLEPIRFAGSSWQDVVAASKDNAIEFDEFVVWWEPLAGDDLYESYERPNGP